MAKRDSVCKAHWNRSQLIGVVKQAVSERERLQEKSGKEIDQTWAVFDKDDLDKTTGNIRNFNESFELGVKENIRIAYSNECFELWLLLHYEDVETETPIPRTELYERLENAVKAADPSFNYIHGNRSIIDKVWETGNEVEAIKRAETLNRYHANNNTTPIESNPNTLVNELVKELRSWLEYYSY